MKTIEQLRDELNHKVRSAADISARAAKDNRVMTGEESKLADELLRETEELKAEIKKIEEDEARAAKIQAHMAEISKPQGRTVAPEQPNGDPTSREMVPAQARKRSGKLKAFSGPRAEENAYVAGSFILASIFNNTNAQRFCRSNGVNFQGALSEGTNTAGGFLVPEELAQAVIDLREEYGVFRREASYIPIRGETILIPRTTNRGTAAFTGEGVALTQSDIALDQVRLVTKKLGRAILFSTELDEDAIISIGEMIADKFAWSFALKEDQCGFIGDGTSTYGGILGLTQAIVNSAHTAGKVAAASGHDTFAEIDSTDLSNLMAKLPAYARMNAKFYCSQVAHDLVFQRLAIGGGGNTIQSMSGKFQPAYLGYPIVVSQVLPTATTALNGTFMIGFGDLKMSSTLAEKRGFTVSRSNEYGWLTDQVAIKATERIDIVNHDLGDTSEAGPFVALVGTT